MTAIQELKELYAVNHKKKYPNVPSIARVTPRYEDVTANGLTKCIVTWLTLNGHKAWRQSSEGRYRPGKQYTDVIGRTKIEKGMYLPGTNKGHGDVQCIMDGRFVAWEVKMKDKQSDVQKKFQQEVENAGGKYFIVHSFDEFMRYYKQITSNENN